MLFSSTEFLYAFLPCTLLLYYLVKWSTPLKNGVLLLASLFFYAWGEPRFVLVMLLSILVNYAVGLWIGSGRRRGDKRGTTAALWTGVAVNLGLLFVFKYLNFTVENISRLFPLGVTLPSIALPIGISFFTFQSMSYVIDVYRGRARVQKNPFYLALYVSLFPQLIAGPIVRYETVAEQIVKRRETWQDFSGGVARFIVGLSKKVLLSNQMGMVADKAFSMNGEGTLGISMAWLGALSYALQIYFDFSGYSDMALGRGHMLCFTFDKNFNYPYISKSVTEFWRRWHMSLGTWFRDYVYIPLGGSRVKSRGRLIFNLAVVWILTGIWHGAAWNFLLWGIWSFVLLTVEKLFFARYLKGEGPTWASVVGYVYAMGAVLFGWVLFRAENLSLAVSYFGAMLGLAKPSEAGTEAILFLTQKWVWYGAAILFSTPILPYVRRRVDALRGTDDGRVLIPALWELLRVPVLLGLLLVCTAFLLKSNYNPFIYFNF